MKKLISVLLCVALMFTFLTMISSAADGAAAADGTETILSIIANLLKNANWGAILAVLVQTVQTFLRIIGAAGTAA